MPRASVAATSAAKAGVTTVPSQRAKGQPVAETPSYLPAVTAVLSFLSRHSSLARAVLGPMASAPPISRYLKVLTRAYLGATAFEIHKVDVKRGRIGIGGVDEVIFSSKFVQLFHEVIAKEAGEAKKDRILYEIGRQGGYYEVDTALKSGRWAPKVLASVIEGGDLIDRIRADAKMAHFFDVVMKMVMRLIINEGGWGAVVDFDYRSPPIRVTLDNTQEPVWVGPSEKPVCRIACGVLAGYMTRLAGEELRAREVECKAMGAPRCVFEIDR